MGKKKEVKKLKKKEKGIVSVVERETWEEAILLFVDEIIKGLPDKRRIMSEGDEIYNSAIDEVIESISNTAKRILKDGEGKKK